jgi:exopolyphosphatase / guanosine-5'-triphosphate,3'-diphosphate pyrophosphatase
VLDAHAGTLYPDPKAVLIGTAGTITTLASMDQGLAQYDPVKVNRYTMTREAVDRMVELLIATTLEERRTIPGLERGREDIIFTGAVVTQELMRRYGFQKMLVSDWGLREGIVLDLYGKIAERDSIKTTER